MSCRCHRRVVSGVTDRGHLLKQLFAKLLALGCEPTALLFGQAEPAAQLFFYNSILFSEVLENLLLFAVEPARQNRHEKDLRRQKLIHATIVAEGTCDVSGWLDEVLHRTPWAR